MLIKAKNIILDFLKSARTSELIELFIAPAIIVALLFLVFSYCNTEVLSQFASRFADSLLTIAALLAAFGIASVTIILTSSSKNVDKAKSIYIDRKNHNNMPISYYQLVIVRNYYNIFVQLFLLIVAVFAKFIIFEGTSAVVLVIESYFLMHSIFVQIFVVTTLYHFMLNDKNEEIDIK